ncbi:hypothetical protein CBW58_11195 [Yersinia frederiksenii]|nr:hypothetical protein CBW58_11195 [Yersinia frederiksenii]
MAGYSAHAAAKSAVGIRTPNSIERTTAQAVTMCGHGYIHDKYNGELGGGHRKMRRCSLLTGSSNLVQFTTQVIRTS